MPAPVPTPGPRKIKPGISGVSVPGLCPGGARCHELTAAWMPGRTNQRAALTIRASSWAEPHACLRISLFGHYFLRSMGSNVNNHAFIVGKYAFAHRD